jgi:hypothetical protein
MNEPVEEARKRGTEWGRDLVSAANRLSDEEAVDALEYLLQETVAHLSKDRGAEFARTFEDAARRVFGKRFPMLGQTRH